MFFQLHLHRRHLVSRQLLSQQLAQRVAGRRLAGVQLQRPLVALAGAGSVAGDLPAATRRLGGRGLLRCRTRC